MVSQWVELRGQLQLAIQNAERLNPDAGNTIADSFDDVFAFIDNEIEKAMPSLLAKKQTT
jgi:hypothetical protein